MAMPELKSQLMEGVGEGASGALGAVRDYPRRVREFFHDVRLEMRHVTWPNWNDVHGTTIVVIVTVFFFGAYFFLLDSILGRTIDYFFKRMR